MATDRQWSVSLWRDQDDVSHCRIRPVPWQNWMAVYLGYTLRIKTLFCGWPVMVQDTHTRRIINITFWWSQNTEHYSLPNDVVRQYNNILPIQYLGGIVSFLNYNKYTLSVCSWAQQNVQLTSAGLKSLTPFVSPDEYLQVSRCSSIVLKPVYSDTTQLDVELSCVAIDTSPTQLNSTRRRVELSCVAINGPLRARRNNALSCWKYVSIKLIFPK